MTIAPVPGRLDAARIEQCYKAGYWRDEIIADLLAKHARERPDAIAIVDGERRCSWAERFALHLRALGIAPGDAVAVQLPNWLEYIVCYHGIQLTGGVMVQVGADWRSAEMVYGYGIGPAKTAIVPREFLEHDYSATLHELRPKLPDLEHVMVARGAAPEGCLSLDDILADPIEDRVSLDTLADCRPGPDQIIRIVFTSGTTGLPKAIMHTNNSLGHSGRTMQADFNFGADDVFLMYVPFSANWGTVAGIQLPLMSGATMVLMDKFSASGALALIERERVTFLSGTPTAFIALTNSPAAEHADLDSLRLVISAGAGIPVESIRELRRKLNTAFINAFGMNEFGMGSWCQLDDDPEDADGTIGRFIPGVETRIVDADGRALPPGETGEMVLKSAGMCAGYHGNPEANEASWDEEGWFRSGDLMTVDDKGYVRIVGRSKDLIIRGGANVSPREVEDVLMGEPRIREVSVIGLPDEYYGEVVCACVIPKAGETPTVDEIQAFLKPRIASYKLPSQVVILDEFPLNSMGKVLKDDLRERVLQSIAD